MKGDEIGKDSGSKYIKIVQKYPYHFLLPNPSAATDFLSMTYNFKSAFSIHFNLHMLLLGM